MISETVSRNRERARFGHHFRNLVSTYRSRIFVIGDKNTANEIVKVIGKLLFDAVWIPDIRNLEDKIDPAAKWVIFAEPVLGIGRGIRNLKANILLQSIPIHVVTSSERSVELVKSYYKLGAESVLAFPEEAKFYETFLRKLEGTKFRNNIRDIGDRRFSRAVTARVATVMPSMKRISVWYRNGIVYFEGNISSLEMKDRIEAILNNAPGVKRIANSGFHLPQNERIDLELDVRLNSMIRQMPDVPNETVSCSVLHGEVVLAGNVPDQKVLKKLNRKIFSAFGLRSIRNFVSISKERVRIDKLIARKINDGINQFYTRSTVEVTVLDRNVILKGSVDKRSKRKMIEELVRQHGKFDRIVNQLRVV